MFWKHAFLFLMCTLKIVAANIAITIDDYPLPDGNLFTAKERAQRFIDIAKKHRCKFAFFCVGQHINDGNDPALLQMLSENGHFLANHSMNHRYLSAISLDEFKEELVSTDELISLYPGMRTWFRYPYLDYGNKEHLGGSISKFMQAYALLEALGYTEGYVTINTFDWYINKCLLDAIKQNQSIDYQALKRVYVSLVDEWMTHYIDLYQREFEIEVTHTLLLHDNSLNALFLDDILTMIEQKGWNIVSPELAFNDTRWRRAFFSKAARLSQKPPSLSCDEIDKLLALEHAIC